MTNVAAGTRRRLAECACIRLPVIAAEQTSRDGTRKFLLRLDDGQTVETVLIPGEERAGLLRLTQCLSCQVGCTMACTFCTTGQMGFVRNMTAGEMLGQILAVRRAVGDTRPDRPLVRNLVFMGMGEPLLNLEAMLRALNVLHDARGLNFSARRITVSTCGLPHGLRELGESGKAFLAVSLHAPDQALRARIMPKAARWPLEDLIATLAAYPLKTRERITLEYLLLGGVNDRPEHARALARIVGRVRAKLNLIVYNPPNPDAPSAGGYAAPTPEALDAFQRVLWDKRITAIVRKSRGQDIAAACGQLRSRRIPAIPVSP
jgi:23S rRNA (adenine2503-C2)-methyltransferase